MLRGADIIPTENLVEFAAGIDERRAQSLDFRFHHEDALLEKANERPAFGWGSWSRWRVFDETGRDITVSDGAWIINISQRGWLGYIAKFGFLTLPLLLLFLRRKRYQVGLATSGLCLIVAANLVDLLPNDSLSPLLWLATGALLGAPRTQDRRAFRGDRTTGRAHRSDCRLGLRPGCAGHILQPLSPHAPARRAGVSAAERLTWPA